MSVKNMLLAGTLAILTLAGCSDEVLIEGNGSSGNVQTTKILFSSGSVKTKAVSADREGYVYTTTDELHIDHLFVAAFFTDGETVGERIDYFNGGFNDSRITSTEEGGFTLSGLILPLKQGIKLVAIANSPAANTYAGMSYEQLMRETTSYSALGGEGYYTFDPKSLVKVGELDFRLNEDGDYTTLDGTAIPTRVVELKQLAAKVRLLLDIELPKLSESVITTTDWNLGGYSSDEIGKVLDKGLMNNATESADDVVNDSQVLVYPDPVSGKLLSVKYGVASNDQKQRAIAIAYSMNGNGHKYAVLRAMNNGVLGRITMKKIQTDYKSVFYLQKVNILNVEKKSALLSPVGAGIQGGQPGHVATEIGMPVTNMDLTLYTYEKPKYESADKESALIVNPIGQATSGAVVTTTTYSVSGNKLRLDWGVGSGWGDGNASFSPSGLIEEGDPVENTVLDQGITIDPSRNKSYKVYINPSFAEAPAACTDGLVHSNYYYVSGRLLAPAPEVNIDLAWQVMGWDGQPIINIGMN